MSDLNILELTSEINKGTTFSFIVKEVKNILQKRALNNQWSSELNEYDDIPENILTERNIDSDNPIKAVEIHQSHHLFKKSAR